MKLPQFAGVAIVLLMAPAASLSLSGPALAQNDQPELSTGLYIPPMDASVGRLLFGFKGCAACHSVNGVGGVDAPPLDAEFMSLPMNPFDFAARMWRGAEAMVSMQREELGYVIELDGDELAAIVAFIHDADEQAKFSEADIPPDIAALLDGDEE